MSDEYNRRTILKFVIAGLGSIGRRHLRNLQTLGESDILLYRTGRSVLPDDELEGFPVEMDLHAALAQRPDALIISNPTALHLDIAIPAAQTGCHIFLEKPISHSLECLDELQAAVDGSGSRVFVGYQFRFHPGLRRARRLVAEGAIGRPLSVRAHWGEYLPGWHPWEDYRQGYSARADLGGGVILTLSHPLDYLRWLFGEVSALWAFAGQLSDLDLQVEDTAEIGLRFDNGVLGSVHLDYNQRPASHRLEIIGTQGTIHWDNTDGATHVFGAGNEGWQTYRPPQGFERNHLFLEQMRHFLEVVKGQVEPICSLDDGIKALQLALAAHDSQVKGQIIDI
jgi:predicted dehydrogenase